MFSLLAFTGAGAEGFVPDVNPSALDTAKVVDVEEVVVVASPKENIKLRKQPVSVTLFSGEGLDNLGVTSVKDLTGFVHNLYIPDYGSRLTSSVYIRGIGSRMNTPAVGMYVDNMPYIDKSAYDFTFLDIDRIDVLNGPQGTLYGRNSMGGLFRVFTSDPLRKQGTKVSLGATGRTTGRRISATTNQKIGNKFAYSVGGYYNAENGFFRNDSTGRKADGSQEAGARLRAVYKANNKLKFDFQTTYSYSDEDAYPYYYSVDHLTNPNCFLLPGQGCCAIISITRQRKELTMIIEVDFDSDEAIYIQLCNQIIMGIATSVIHEGDSLPSVRQLADTIGVNMHTVNKAYSVLKREGYISLDKRRGAVIALDIDKMEQLEEMRRELKIVLARGCCKNISRREVHDLVDEIFDDYE